MEGEGLAELAGGHVDEQRQEDVGADHGEQTPEAVHLFGPDAAQSEAVAPVEDPRKELVSGCVQALNRLEVEAFLHFHAFSCIFGLWRCQRIQNQEDF